MWDMGDSWILVTDNWASRPEIRKIIRRFLWETIFDGPSTYVMALPLAPINPWTTALSTRILTTRTVKMHCREEWLPRENTRKRKAWSWRCQSWLFTLRYTQRSLISLRKTCHDLPHKICGTHLCLGHECWPSIFSMFVFGYIFIKCLIWILQHVSKTTLKENWFIAIHHTVSGTSISSILYNIPSIIYRDKCLLWAPRLSVPSRSKRSRRDSVFSSTRFHTPDKALRNIVHPSTQTSRRITNLFVHVQNCVEPPMLIYGRKKRMND